MLSARPPHHHRAGPTPARGSQSCLSRRVVLRPAACSSSSRHGDAPAALLLPALAVGVLLLGAPGADAADLARGKQVFQANCAQCHVGGRNTIVANKTLRLADLQKFNMDSVEAIVAQVTRGKGAMPAFRGRLSPSDIQAVSEYVLQQARSGWR